MPVIYLIWHADYEQSNVTAVFSTKEKAEDFLLRYREGNEKHKLDYCLSIEEYKLDDPENDEVACPWPNNCTLCR